MSTATEHQPEHQHFDVVVIGGGPGGTTAATLLAQRGHRVLVLERERHPRFHVGESLLPSNNKLFRTLGVFDELCKGSIVKWGAEFVAPDGQTRRTYYFKDQLDPNEPHAFEVERSIFDEMLVRNCERKGAVVREEHEVTEVLFEGGRAVGVRAQALARGPDGKPAPTGAPYEVRSTFVVDASGRDTFLSSKKGWKKKDLPISKTAFFGHWEDVTRLPGSDAGNITIATWEHGWTWIIPLHRQGTKASVGLVCHKEWVRQKRKDESVNDFYLRTLRQAPIVWDRLAPAKQLVPAGTIPDISYRSERLAGDGFVLVGDAGTFMDPIFSSGIHLAMTGAQMAADAIDQGLREGRTDAGLFAAYERENKAASETFFRFIYAWYTPELHRLFYRPTKVLGLLETVTSMLAGDVFDWKKRARAELFFGLVAFERWRWKRAHPGETPPPVWQPQSPA